ncbi:MAG: cyclic pyranopterin monophosphate synthase MoaC [Aestuariivita sp.]|nr:cyclic pyranopterin monophosphate synthase MoaC [Aestuariivita sp.]MCY4202606.1 cyclic pyranopterin monophosphate synthase MoaC [Aestuariivita sp.]
MAKLTHFDSRGNANMVDVSGKPHTERTAVAAATVKMKPETLELISQGNNKKGDVRSVAQIAGIMAAKRTAEIIPLCHPLPLSKLSVELELDSELPGLRISALAKTTGQTGVEMEALTAASAAALTVYDMLKSADRAMEIGNIRLLSKEGGKSGRFEAT